MNEMNEMNEMKKNQIKKNEGPVGPPNTKGTCWFNALWVVLLYSDGFYNIVYKNIPLIIERFPEFGSMLMTFIRNRKTRDDAILTQIEHVIEELHKIDPKSFNKTRKTCSYYNSFYYVTDLLYFLTKMSTVHFIVSPLKKNYYEFVFYKTIYDGGIKHHHTYLFYGSQTKKRDDYDKVIAQGMKELQHQITISLPSHLRKNANSPPSLTQKSIYGKNQVIQLTIENNFLKDNSLNFDMKNVFRFPSRIKLPENLIYNLKGCLIYQAKHVVAGIVLNDKDMIHENGSIELSKIRLSAKFFPEKPNVIPSCPFVHFPWRKHLISGEWIKMFKVKYDIDQCRLLLKMPNKTKGASTYESNESPVTGITALYLLDSVKNKKKINKKDEIAIQKHQIPIHKHKLIRAKRSINFVEFMDKFHIKYYQAIAFVLNKIKGILKK